MTGEGDGQLATLIDPDKDFLLLTLEIDFNVFNALEVNTICLETNFNLPTAGDAGVGTTARDLLPFLLTASTTFSSSASFVTVLSSVLLAALA